MSVMSHMNEHERRKVKDIDNNIVDAVRKLDHADESGLTPIRTRRLKAEDTNTTQEKAEMDDELDTEDDALDDLDTENDELYDLDTEDEEVIYMEKELKKLRAERKT